MAEPPLTRSALQDFAIELLPELMAGTVPTVSVARIHILVEDAHDRHPVARLQSPSQAYSAIAAARERFSQESDSDDLEFSIDL